MEGCEKNLTEVIFLCDRDDFVTRTDLSSLTLYFLISNYVFLRVFCTSKIAPSSTVEFW